ncbi:MAG: helix-turn-helix transcriptional regulator [Phycisphaerales bacterium]|nr:helix-turn-helix transcriptional regulator [Phycisphaerales bacterium]
MVEYSPATLDSIFQALGDPSRRHILHTLAAGEASISDLARPLRMSLAAVSKHIQTLARAGLIRRAKRGRTHYCQLEPAAFAEAHQWLAFYERFWSSRLDALEAQLRREDQHSAPGASPTSHIPHTPERKET